ncbi:hypothetical protein [Chondromyces crocatus]|uniref:Lipoprotein n=1 Tax=Chondromyces crocatus TaxID=52 RepID=A0A0K1EBD3_CHOCO|nr:hypothetical protein [Chondromyces crocatus]AKT38154.1 uncharacterized protein CMC5_022970 [Chondromyces crocatus]
MFASKLFQGIAVAFAVGASGCITIPEVDLSGLLDGSSITVQADGRADGKTTVQACVRVSLSLGCDGDGSIVAASEGQAVALAREALPDEELFLAPRGELDGSAEGKEIVIAYDGYVQAPGSRVVLPLPFTITGPVQTNEDTLVLQSSDALPLTWEPALGDDAMAWSVSGTCAGDDGEESSVFREFSISHDEGDLALSVLDFGLPAGKRCELVLDLLRQADGLVDPAFMPGASVVRGRQVRSLSLVVEP